MSIASAGTSHNSGGRSQEFSHQDDQIKLLDQALQVIKVQANQMKKCLNSDQLMDAFKNGTQDPELTSSIFNAQRASHICAWSKALL